MKNNEPKPIPAKLVFSGLTKSDLKKVVEAREQGYGYMVAGKNTFYYEYKDLPKNVHYVDISDLYSLLLERVFFGKK